jgi:hypothetical protein
MCFSLPRNHRVVNRRGDFVIRYRSVSGVLAHRVGQNTQAEVSIAWRLPLLLFSTAGGRRAGDLAHGRGLIQHPRTGKDPMRGARLKRPEPEGGCDSRTSLGPV